MRRASQWTCCARVCRVFRAVLVLHRHREATIDARTVNPGMRSWQSHCKAKVCPAESDAARLRWCCWSCSWNNANTLSVQSYAGIRIRYIFTCALYIMHVCCTYEIVMYFSESFPQARARTTNPNGCRTRHGFFGWLHHNIVYHPCRCYICCVLLFVCRVRSGHRSLSVRRAVSRVIIASNAGTRCVAFRYSFALAMLFNRSLR